jgi:uncharacterized protein (DUF2141 family)
MIAKHDLGHIFPCNLELLADELLNYLKQEVVPREVMERSMLRFAQAVLITTSLAGAAMMSSNANASSGRLTVEIDGLKNRNGQICLSLFSQSEGFPGKSDRAVAVQCIQASEASLGVTFENLIPGNYAVALFHDANSDGKLNTGLFGIPKEGFGFSRNPRIRTRAPRFDEAALALSTQTNKIQIQVKYF